MMAAVIRNSAIALERESKMFDSSASSGLQRRSWCFRIVYLGKGGLEHVLF